MHTPYIPKPGFQVTVFSRRSRFHEVEGPLNRATARIATSAPAPVQLDSATSLSGDPDCRGARLFLEVFYC